jgi:hypothetical protein
MKLKRPIKDLDEIFNNLDEKFSKEIRILEKKKGSLGNEKFNKSNSMERITNRLD